jgi:cation-transporting ATPase E
MGLVILSSLVIGLFPIALRNASAITLLSVGIPTVFLAIWAQPGQLTHDSLGRTILRFVLPAAMLSSLGGLVVFYGSLGLTLLEAAAGTGLTLSPTEQALAISAGLPAAQSALSAFLVLVGLGLIAYVEPPTKWLAVVQSISTDWRPVLLAIGLAVAFVVLTVIEPLGNIFALVPLGAVTWLIVLAVFVVWFVTLRAVWRYRLIDRFVGA